MTGPVRVLRASLVVSPRLEPVSPDGTGFGVSDTDGPVLVFPDSASGRRLAAVILDGCDQADAATAKRDFGQDPPATEVPA